MTSKQKDQNTQSKGEMQNLESEIMNHTGQNHQNTEKEELPRVEHKLLDDRYLLLKTIGHGRYAK